MHITSFSEFNIIEVDGKYGWIFDKDPLPGIDESIITAHLSRNGIDFVTNEHVVKLVDKKGSLHSFLSKSDSFYLVNSATETERKVSLIVTNPG